MNHLDLKSIQNRNNSRKGNVNHRVRKCLYRLIFENWLVFKNAAWKRLYNSLVARDGVPQKMLSPIPSFVASLALINIIILFKVKIKLK